MFNKSLSFLLIMGGLHTTALAQEKVEIPNCFHHLVKYGTYQIQFHPHINITNMHQALSFLNISGFRWDSVDYRTRQAQVSANPHSFQGQKDALAALNVLNEEGLFQKVSCSGMAGPRPRIGVAN